MPPAGFEPTIPAIERPQTQALDRAATGAGNSTSLVANNLPVVHCAVGATDSFVKYTRNRRIILGKELDGKSDAPSEKVEEIFNQEYQLHCSVEPAASVFRVEDTGNTYLQNIGYILPKYTASISR